MGMLRKKAGDADRSRTDAIAVQDVTTVNTPLPHSL